MVRLAKDLCYQHGAFEAARLVAKSMIATGIKGAIVNVASEAGKKGHTESLAYSASKAALISITRTLLNGALRRVAASYVEIGSWARAFGFVAWTVPRVYLTSCLLGL